MIGLSSLNISRYDNNCVKILNLWRPFGSDVYHHRRVSRHDKIWVFPKCIYKVKHFNVVFHWCSRWIDNLHCSMYFRVINQFRIGVRLSHEWFECDFGGSCGNYPVKVEDSQLMKDNQLVAEISAGLSLGLCPVNERISPWANGGPRAPHDPPWVVPFCSGDPQESY